MIRRMYALSDAASPVDASTGPDPTSPTDPPPPVDGPEPLVPPPPHDPPIRVLVVDADRRVRGAMASLIALAASLELVGSVGHVASAVEILETAPVDVVVLDPKLPDIDAGIGLVEHIRTHWPASGIVVLAWSDPRDPALFPSRADRYLPKTVSPSDLITALEGFARPRPNRGGNGPANVQ